MKESRSVVAWGQEQLGEKGQRLTGKGQGLLKLITLFTPKICALICYMNHIKYFFTLLYSRDWHNTVNQWSAQLCPTLCDPMGCSPPCLPAHHRLPELTQTHVHWVSDTIQWSHPLLSPSPPTFNLSQHQSLFKWVSSSHQVAKVLEFQLQHQSFQWIIFRTDFL